MQKCISLTKPGCHPGLHWMSTVDQFLLWTDIETGFIRETWRSQPNNWQSSVTWRV